MDVAEHQLVNLHLSPPSREDLPHGDLRLDTSGAQEAGAGGTAHGEALDAEDAPSDVHVDPLERCGVGHDEFPLGFGGDLLSSTENKAFKNAAEHPDAEHMKDQDGDQHSEPLEQRQAHHFSARAERGGTDVLERRHRRRRRGLHDGARHAGGREERGLRSWGPRGREQRGAGVGAGTERRQAARAHLDDRRKRGRRGGFSRRGDALVGRGDRPRQRPAGAHRGVFTGSDSDMVGRLRCQRPARCSGKGSNLRTLDLRRGCRLAAGGHVHGGASGDRPECALQQNDAV
mmetsp:Transcript_8445/g.24277  ORF Transcript_8445/g.24277 Transcript_8445/m.24277 type:complete len:288 (-) Transcript_8445:89-952(-)